MHRILLVLILAALACGGGGTSTPPPPPPPPVQSVPSQPGNVVATPGNGSVTVSWSPVDGATSYEIGRLTLPGASDPKVSTSTTTTFADTAVQNGTTYSYAVDAVNAAGRGQQSNAVTARPFRLICSANTLNSQIVAFNAEDSSAQAPVLSFGSATGISGINFSGIDVDPVHGEIFSANFWNQDVTVHSLAANGNAVPLRALGNQSGINVAYDSTGDNLLVVSQGTISTFARATQGFGHAPVRQLTPAALASKVALAGPTHGDLMFVGAASSLVMTYARTSSGSQSPSAEFSVTPLVQASTIIYDPTADQMLMALDNLQGGGNAGVAAVPSGASADHPEAVRILGGDQTGLTNVTALGLDSAHDVLHVADASGQIFTFPADFSAHANLAPTSVLGGALAQFTGGIRDLVFDPVNGHLIVHAGTRILTFAANASGNTAPLSVISSTGGGVETPLGMAFDSLHQELLVANGDTRQTLAAFAPPAANASTHLSWSTTAPSSAGTPAPLPTATRLRSRRSPTPASSPSTFPSRPLAASRWTRCTARSSSPTRREG